MSAQIDLHVTPRIGDSGGHLGLCSCRIRARSQPDQGSKIELPDAAQFCPIEPHRLEDLGALRELVQRAHLLPGRKAEVRAQHTDHDMWLAVETYRFPDRAGSGPESSPP